MLTRFLLAVALSWLFSAPAHAQQNQCRTSPVGASTAYCSSEAFVSQSIAAVPAVQYTSQTLTAAQQLQARQNIGAAGRMKMLTVTRSMTAAAGNVSYTGLGFKPKALIATGGVNGTNAYIIYSGMAESATPAQGSTGAFGTSGGAVSANFLQAFSATATNGIFAQVLSYDADGFTLTWGASGSPPAGTANFFVMCFE